MSTYLYRHAARPVPQSEAANARQVKNNAGGYVFKVDPETAVRRFIVLGSEGGTYYTSEQKLTKDNTELLQDFAKTNARKLVDLVVEISEAGLAPKQSPGLYALAIAASVPESAKDRNYALAALPRVARTATSLFEFVSYVTQFRGWGNALRRAVGAWYSDKAIEDLGYQTAKYRSRHGYTHRDLLRLSHPEVVGDAHNALFGALVGRSVPVDSLPESYASYVKADTITSVDEAVTLIESGANVSWEYFNTALHKEPEFWNALLDNNKIPVQAVLRNLPRFTALGVDDNPHVLEILNGETKGHKFLHPVNVAIAAEAYSKGANKNLNWSPNRHISYALDNLVERSFKNSEPTGKRVLVAVDVSGSMWGYYGYSYDFGAAPALTPAKMAAITSTGFAKHGEADFVAFTSTLSEIKITKSATLKSVEKKFSGLGFGGTDCAQPMIWAEKNGRKYDAFVVLTDNETWAGSIHPTDALKRYRKSSGITDAKLVVAAFTPTEFSIADPQDPNMLDVTGTDSSVVQVVNNFIAGRI